jgi:hypothetical protein
MRVVMPAGISLSLASAVTVVCASAALGQLGPAAADLMATPSGGALTPLAAADRSIVPLRNWCVLSPLTGGPGQGAPPPAGTSDHDSRYQRADPRPPTRQPTAPCQPATAA